MNDSQHRERWTDGGQKRYTLGTHRVCTPEETLERIAPLLPRMGITRIANITGLDRLGVPVTMVCRPNSRSLAVFQGKGLSLAAAKASGVMEAIETYHAERIPLALKLGSWRELEPEHALVDVEKLPRSAQNKFSRDRRILWVEGSELNCHTRLWLPFEIVHADFTVPRPMGSGCFPANTNGLASGNHLLEAINHGLSEVVERDAITLWLRRDLQSKARTTLDLATVEDSDCRALLDHLRACDVEVVVWDVTSDVGIPTYYCLVRSGAADDVDPEFGGGCHPCREIALLRAITESVQARTTFIAGSRDDFGPRIYGAGARRGRALSCEALVKASKPARTLADAPSLEATGLESDLHWMLGRLRSTGYGQVVYVDLTLPGLDIPVVRVVVPGLEGVYKGPRSDYVPGLRARRDSGGAL
jgi:ribosomal protein S12 methylthiotransferase accessory factor